MSIGYACLNIGNNMKIKSLRLSDANEESIIETSRQNLNVLNRILEYNIENNIKLFRISSDIIPLGSHEFNKVKWWKDLKTDLEYTGKKIRENNIRVSVHPGQYTVLNSNNNEVVDKAIKDLIYHQRFLDSLGVGNESKIILHVGGMYGNKEEAIKRFINNYKILDDCIKKRLVIENDDKIFNANGVLRIHNEIGLPVVFDVLHDKANFSDSKYDTYDWIEIFSKTWGKEDGKQKIHYSESKNEKEIRSHSNYIKAYSFMEFYNNLDNKDIDIMLEVKDKNLSAVKCNNLTNNNLKITDLEKEWSKYKYYVLSKDANIYKEIRELLKYKEKPNVIKFYKLIEESLDKELLLGNDINAIQHMWGYLRDIANDEEKETYNKKIDRYKTLKNTNKPIKKYLLELSEKYKADYLVNSIYFYI
ncbi:MAG TPA: UV DNA damage repair endonuclease UvsE [Anaerovoracaceae bacterium]|nr:UV DNA damage repair endonuclease UvsE [Anaerovoracaceae bacterium]